MEEEVGNRRRGLVEAEVVGFLEHEGAGGFVFVGDDAIEDGIFDGGLEDADFTAWGEVEGGHDLLTHDGGLEIADTITLFEFDHLLADEFVVGAITADFLLVFGGDVGIAKEHEVVDIVACLKEKAADSGIGDGVFDKGDGAHVEVDEFLNVGHLLVLGELHAGEELGNHALPEIIMIVERPADAGLPFLGTGLAYVVEEGGPAEPKDMIEEVFLGEVGRGGLVLAGEGIGGDGIENLEGVVEDIFVAATVFRFDTFEGGKFGEDELEEACFVEEFPADGGAAGKHDFVELIGNTLLRDDADSLGVSFDGLEGGEIEVETELAGKSDAPHHAEGVVGEGDVGVEGCADDALFHVVEASEWVEEFSVTSFVEADGECVDGEIASVLIVSEGAIFDDGIA